MKKKWMVAVGACVLTAVSFSIGVYAASDIRLLVNDKQLDADIQIIEGSSYVPLRVVSEALGADVRWDENARTISIYTRDFPVAKSFDVNVRIYSGPMIMTISKVTLDPAFQKDKYTKPIKAVLLDVTLENTSTTLYRWYPTQGSLYLNTNEKADASKSTYYSDNIDGEFDGKVIKKGQMVVQVNSDLNDITSFNFMLDGATDGHTYKRIISQPVKLK